MDSKSLLDDFKIKTGYGEIWNKIRNSHVPDMTVNYLQMVDEPGVKQVVSRFSSHEFKGCFKAPLAQHH